MIAPIPGVPRTPAPASRAHTETGYPAHWSAALELPRASPQIDIGKAQKDLAEIFDKGAQLYGDCFAAQQWKETRPVSVWGPPKNLFERIQSYIRGLEETIHQTANFRREATTPVFQEIFEAFLYYPQRQSYLLSQADAMDRGLVTTRLRLYWQLAAQTIGENANLRRYLVQTAQIHPETAASFKWRAQHNSWVQGITAKQLLKRLYASPRTAWACLHEDHKTVQTPPQTNPVPWKSPRLWALLIQVFQLPRSWLDPFIPTPLAPNTFFLPPSSSPKERVTAPKSASAAAIRPAPSTSASKPEPTPGAQGPKFSSSDADKRHKRIFP